MKKVYQKLIFVAIIATTLITGCEKDDTEPENPNPVNESEVMTTFKLTFVDSAGTAPNVIAQYRDPDGDGGNSAVQFDIIRLLPNKTYLASVQILDETKNPAVNISNEILEEANDHMFFYTPSSVNATITLLDLDTNTPALPIGLQTKWKTGALSDGTVRVILRHQPGVKDGTYAVGETDIDLTFEFEVEP